MSQYFNFFSSMMSGGSSGNWTMAEGLATSIATGGEPDHNVDVGERLNMEQLVRVAELQVQTLTGLTLDEPVTIEALNRSQWSHRFLADQRPLFEPMSASIGAALSAQLDDLDGIDLEQQQELGISIPGMEGMGFISPEMLQQIMSMMSPMILGIIAGNAAGHLGSRAFGHYELPLPRPKGPLTVALPNLDAFAREWSIADEDIRLWVCLSDVAHHHVLDIPHVRMRIETLLTQYVQSFNQDPEAIEQQIRQLGLDDFDDPENPDLQRIQELANRPDMLLSIMQSEQQRRLMPEIAALIGTIEGYVDWVLDQIGTTMLSEYDRVTEALRRRRVEAGPASRFVEHLFGLELTQSTYDNGAAFITGVIDRAGPDALALLWSDPTSLPTVAEFSAPGLWLARLGVEADLDPLDEDFEVPDFPDWD